MGRGLLQNFEIALVATVGSLAVSFPLCFLAACNASPHGSVFHATRFLLSCIRALPELVWALVFVSAVGLGALAGMLALAVVSVGFTAKFFAESVEVVNPRAVEGIAAHGASRLQMRLRAMLPEAAPDFVANFLYVLDHNVRSATVLGVVGAGGIGYYLISSMRLFLYERVLLICIGIYLSVAVLDRLSAAIRRRLI